MPFFYSFFMSFITQDCIEEIRTRVSIIDIVSPYVNLKHSGSSMVGLSPFNTEKTPSFHVWENKGIYKCFSSNQAGNIFTFIQSIENLSFPEAIEFIADKYKISLRYETGGPDTQSRSLTKELFRMHQLVSDFFHQAFLENSEEGEFARNYFFNERKFSGDTANIFQVGWAPVTPQRLANFLQSQSFSYDLWEKSGLFFRNRSHQTNSFLTRFRGRLMIPIRDIQGRCVAFTARKSIKTPPNDPAYEAKYVNSPETPIFSKSKILFNLDLARKEINDTSKILLVEGQIDAIRCYEAGIKSVVAPQGTAITTTQLQLIRRYSNQIDCLLDGDQAGQKAAFRMLPMALKEGIDVKFLPIPEGSDPDSLISEKGSSSFYELQNGSYTSVEFAVKYLLPNPSEASYSSIQNTLEKLFEIFSNIESEALCEKYLKKLSALLKIEQSKLGTDFERYLKTKWKDKNSHTKPQLISKDTALNDKKPPLLTHKQDSLLYILLNYESLAKKIAQVINYQWIDCKKTSGRVLKKVLIEVQEELWEDPLKANSLFENETETTFFYEVLSDSREVENPKKAAELIIKDLYLSYYRTQLKILQDEKKVISHKDLETLFSKTKEIKKTKEKLLNPPKFTL